MVTISHLHSGWLLKEGEGLVMKKKRMWCVCVGGLLVNKYIYESRLKEAILKYYGV
jgi:hypothetical protein